ncbi:STAS domain-containing protein [Roseateles oligotrophus]|uniref:Anti-sigma factor antagonist n=1 Tax=Roseateles oligotrophus TaxID=1769250 RepID=A0ABT2YE32_9BURK|nr:STAS domain-containing protein [Roseateles oligotrophus]MCV2368318.1 STAS domain-containing protein [Roseateles oligotrophus]
MELVITEIGGTTKCVRLDGRLDATGADQIGVRFTASTAATGQHAIIDLAAVPFIASMGIRLLISSARALHAKGAKMVLFGAQEMVQDLLEQAAVDQIIPLVATEQQALDLLQA